MTWVKLDEHMPENAKVLEAGPLAAWMHVCAIAYSNRHLTDGFVPYVMLNRLIDIPETYNEAQSEHADRLVAVGLWKWDEERRGWWIHDFHDYQPSAEEQRAKRKAKADAGRVGGVRSGQVRAQRAEGNEAEPKQVLQAEPKQVVEPEGKQKSNGLEPRSVPFRSVPTPNDGAAKPPKRGRQLPDGAPNDDLCNWANGKYPLLDAYDEAQRFRDHHLARGSVFKDWNAAWRTWMSNAAKWQRPTRTTPKRSPEVAATIAAHRARKAARRGVG